MIGDHTSFNGHTHLALTEGKKIHIGKDCMFASDVTVRTGDSHSIIEAESGRRINEAMDITIGEHVWFANHVILLKGASIGPHCIIGSGSVVTAPFDESNAVLAGNPAKVVRRGIDWCRERL
jgi:acetyltransferase-like isoleucine patch superfamily enzyme